MAIQPISSLVQVNQLRVQSKAELATYPAAPASVVAVPVETARAEVNMMSMFPALMMPTPDGIYTISSVALKPAASISVQPSGFSNWGF